MGTVEAAGDEFHRVEEPLEGLQEIPERRKKTHINVLSVKIDMMVDRSPRLHIEAGCSRHFGRSSESVEICEEERRLVAVVNLQEI